MEFESDDSDDDISDGDAEYVFCTGLLTHDKHGEKWAECVRCYRTHEDCGVDEDNFLCPMSKKKSVKL